MSNKLLMQKTKNYYAFIKIGQEKHIDEFQKEGRLYCNSLRYHRKSEDIGVKGDRNEGMGLIKQVPRLDLLEKSKILGTAYRAQLYVDNPKLQGNIFCMYGFESSKLDHSSFDIQRIVIEDSNKEFGEFALVIHNPQGFKNRLEAHLVKNSIEYEFEPVYYYDPLTTNAELDQYCKSNKYRYQNEVRLWLPDITDEPRSIWIGGISDLSIKLPVSQLDKLVAQFVKS